MRGGGSGCVAALLTAAIVFLIALAQCSPSTTPTSTNPTAPPEPDRNTLARQYTKIRITSLEKAGFDNIMVINAVLINGNNFPVKDVEITCTPVARSGTELRKLIRTAYEIVPTKGERTLSKFSMGLMSDQSHQARCEITDASPAR